MWLLSIAAARVASAADPELELCRAASAGDKAGVERALARGALLDLYKEVRVGSSSSSESQMISVIMAFLTAGLSLLAEIGSSESSPVVAVHGLTCALSAPEPSRSVVALMLDAGANPDVHGGSALNAYLSLHAEDEDAAEWYRWLRSRGASAPSDATMLLVEDRAEASPAVLDILDLLLSDGVPSPICRAADLGDLAVLAHLAGETEPQCHRGSPLLTVAASGGRTEVVRWLLARGADPNRLDGYQITPLRAAVRSGPRAAASVELLLAHGADPLWQSELGGSVLVDLPKHPEHVAAILGALPLDRAVTWAVAAITDPYSPAQASAAMEWLPQPLRAPLVDREMLPWLTFAKPDFFSEALAGGSVDALAQTLSSPFGSALPALALSENACLPQFGATRREIGSQWGRSKREGKKLRSYQGGLDVRYERGRAIGVAARTPEALRAGGCEGEALRALTSEPWQRAWRYGAHAERYGWGSLETPLSDDGTLRWRAETQLGEAHEPR